MVLITGTLLATDASVDEVLALSLEHVHRSRLEDGCLSHAVARDVENPLLLTFTERWRDMAAVQAHFAVPASRTFAKATGALAAATLQVYDATSVMER